LGYWDWFPGITRKGLGLNKGFKVFQNSQDWLGLNYPKLNSFFNHILGGGFQKGFLGLRPFVSC